MSTPPPVDPGPSPAESDLDADSLLELLHLLPTGLLRAGLDGEVSWMNPAAARLLAQRLGEVGDFNVHRLLAPWAPDLAERVAEHGARRGVVHRWEAAGAGADADGGTRPFTITMLKLQRDPQSLVLVFTECLT